MSVFVNNVFISSTGIKYVELVLHNKLTLLNNYVLLTYDDALTYCDACVKKGINVVDWKNGTLEFSKNMRVTSIPDNMTLEVGVTKEEPIQSVYSLYYDLAKIDALFIPSVDFYEDGFIGICSSFNSLRVSSSSMNVVISYYNIKKDVWSTAKLIHYTDSKMQQESFLCAIPKDKVSEFYGYGLEEVKDITINNEVFTLLKYCKNLAIYRTGYLFNLPEPVIVSYVLNSLRYDSTIKLLNLALKQIKKDIGLPLVELPKGKSEIRSSSVFSDKVGVFFKDTCTKLKKEDLFRLYLNVVNLYVALTKQGGTSSPSLDSIKKLLSEMNLPFYLDIAVYTLFTILFVSGGVNERCVDTMYQCLQDAKLVKLNSDLYLYSLRLSIFKHKNVLDYKGNTNVFYLVSSEGAVRGEAWI